MIEELADVLSFAFFISRKTQLGYFDIVSEKLKKCFKVYPVEKRKARKKYNEL
jgi:hypothetical protein